MSIRKLTWSADDIYELKGQEESIRLEIKSGALLDKPQSAWVSDLSKEISAFANTEGGILVLGVQEEKKSKIRVAGDPDGIELAITTDQLQRLLEGNLSPYLPGIRVHRVTIPALTNRIVYIIDVPQGTTAYQANDYKYYGRSELEVKALPDHEVRLRMARGKVSRASIVFQLNHVSMSVEREVELRQNNKEACEAFNRDPGSALKKYPELDKILNSRFESDIIDFELLIKNDGELTIRDPSIKFLEHRPDKLSHSPLSSCKRLSGKIDMRGEVIFPGDQLKIPESQYNFKIFREIVFQIGEYMVEWKIFLDNSPPSAGNFDLGEWLSRHRKLTNLGLGIILCK